MLYKLSEEKTWKHEKNDTTKQYAFAKKCIRDNKITAIHQNGANCSCTNKFHNILVQAFHPNRRKWEFRIL